MLFGETIPKKTYQKSDCNVHVNKAPNTLQTAMPPLLHVIAKAQPSGVHANDVTLPAFLPCSAKKHYTIQWFSICHCSPL